MRNMDQVQLKSLLSQASTSQMILNAMTSSTNAAATNSTTTSPTTHVQQLIGMNNNDLAGGNNNGIVTAAGDDAFTRQLVALHQFLCLQQQSALNTIPLLQSSPVTPSPQLSSYLSPNPSTLISNNLTTTTTTTSPEAFSISTILNLSPTKLVETSATTTKQSDRKMSQDIVGLLCPPPPVLTPNSTSASSPNASLASTSSKLAEEVQEEDSDLFVDVESIETTMDGEDRRKAHVEFYRKMKSMRQREKQLQCAICQKKVDNVENTIQTHISEHAQAGGYQCRLCGWQSNDKYRIYEHMRKDHPRKVDMFNDKRDMPKMCNYLVQCFPRSTTRPKKESDKNAERFLDDLMRDMEDCQQSSRPCQICHQHVKRGRLSITRHVQTNHTLKCKICKIITISIDDQLDHQRDVHSLNQPKMSVHYAPSAAAVFLFPSLEKCFPITKCC